MSSQKIELQFGHTRGLGYYQQMLIKKFDLLYMSTEEFKNKFLLAKILNIRQDLFYLF